MNDYESSFELTPAQAESVRRGIAKAGERYREFENLGFVSEVGLGHLWEDDSEDE